MLFAAHLCPLRLHATLRFLAETDLIEALLSCPTQVMQSVGPKGGGGSVFRLRKWERWQKSEQEYQLLTLSGKE